MIEIKRTRQQAAQMPAERAQKAADGLDAQAMELHAPSAETALKREIKPFTGMDARRDYRAMYRAAFAYHEQHSPPQVDRAYWQTHTPGIDDTPQLDLEYWAQAAKDICEICSRFDNDSFMTDLLTGIYSELEREYKAARQQAAGQTFTGE